MTPPVISRDEVRIQFKDGSFTELEQKWEGKDDGYEYFRNLIKNKVIQDSQH